MKGDLPFVPFKEPQCDFLLTTNKDAGIRDSLVALGATAYEMDGYSAFVWNSRLTNRFMVGVGVLDSKFYTGPRALENIPGTFGAGNYSVIDLQPAVARVYPDYFGLNTIYAGNGIVTNRLHLAALIVKTINPSVAISAFYNDTGFSYQSNLFETPIKGISLIAAESYVELSKFGIDVKRYRPDNSFETADPEQYWALLDQGASEVVSNLEAVVESGFPVFCDLSGGKDSRMVYSAVVAAGLQDRVVLNTIVNPGTAILETDLRIATGLAKRFGGSYTGRPVVNGYAEYTVEQNLHRRRSQRFGSYHWLQPTDVRPRSALTKVPTFRLMGGGGEFYRSVAHAQFFPGVDWDAESSSDLIRETILGHEGTKLSVQYAPLYIDSMISTFEALPGDQIGNKIDSHYMNFRSRFHFGAQQTLPEMMTIVNVAMTPSLVAAARSLPSQERFSGRVLYDVISTLVPELAQLEFETPFAGNVFDSEYNRTSTRTGDLQYVEGAPEMVSGIRNHPTAQLPVVPNSIEWEFNTILETEIETSLELLSDPGSIFNFFVGPELIDYIDDARKTRPSAFSAVASKLRSFADYESFNER